MRHVYSPLELLIVAVLCVVLYLAIVFVRLRQLWRGVIIAALVVTLLLYVLYLVQR